MGDRDELKCSYVRLLSLGDLARNAIDSQSHISAMPLSRKYRLFTEGERLAGLRMVYYFDSHMTARYLTYANDDSGERAGLVDSVPEQGGYGLMRLPILEVESSPYAPAKGKRLKVAKIAARDHESLIRALVNEANAGDDSPPKVYVFPSGKGRVVGSFGLFRDRKSFTYARIDGGEPFPCFSYDYITDTIRVERRPGQGSGIQIRVVNLAEPFQFF